MRFPAFRDQIMVMTFVVLALAVGGCGGEVAGPVIYPVSGKVYVDGKPAPKARISFHAVGRTGRSPEPYAIANDDGTFRPTTLLPEDGAPAGD